MTLLRKRIRTLGKYQLAIAALVATTLVVAALAVVARTVFFPPRYRGWSEVTGEGRVAGWAVDEYEPARRVEVQLYVDGSFVAAGVAQLPRPDVLEAGGARDEFCGYSFPLPALAAGRHEARVYAAHTVGGSYRTLILTGKPLRFTIEESGVISQP